MIKTRLSLTVSAFVLSACASAAVAPPSINGADLQKEQTYQKGYAEQVKADPNKTYTVGQADVDRLAAVAKNVRAAGTDVCAKLGTASNCNYPIKLVTEPKEEANVPNAYADGTTIFITLAMLATTPKTEELAFVLSHEYSHNILTHVSLQTRNAMMGMALGTLADQLFASRGFDTGGELGKFGSQYAATKYSVSYEREADYVGLYILDHAGYDVKAADDTWRRMGAQNPDSIYLQTTHPTSAERYLSMQQTSAEIAAKKKAGQPVYPNAATKK